MRHAGDGHYGTGTAHSADEHGGFAVLFARALVDKLADGWHLHNVTAFEEGELPRRLWRVTQRAPLPPRRRSNAPRANTRHQTAVTSEDGPPETISAHLGHVESPCPNDSLWPSSVSPATLRRHPPLHLNALYRRASHAPSIIQASVPETSTADAYSPFKAW